MQGRRAYTNKDGSWLEGVRTGALISVPAFLLLVVTIICISRICFCISLSAQGCCVCCSFVGRIFDFCDGCLACVFCSVQLLLMACRERGEEKVKDGQTGSGAEPRRNF